MIASAYTLLITKRKKKNGKYPVKVRIVYNRKSKDFPIGLDLTEQEYQESINERPKKECRSFALKIEESKIKANKIINELGIFTFKKFEDAFYGRLKDASDVYQLFDEYIGILKTENRIKTASSYETAKNSFKDYKNQLGLYDIDKKFLQAYHQYQIKKPVSGKRAGLSETTIGIYVRSLRTVYNYAIGEGIIKKDENYPFGRRQYIIPAGRNIKKALTIDEVKLIYNYSTFIKSPADKARDFWILSYLLNGVNFKDIALFKNKHLDGNMLRFVREKSRNTSRGNRFIISCYLPEQAHNIIKKWRSEGNDDDDDFIFSIVSKRDSIETQQKRIDQFIKTTNKYMKRICRALELSKEVTTYHGRHSAATILKRSGASLQQIQEALGHHSATTTQKYLDSFDDESKEELAKSLTKFL